ncbi:uncharacterized protein LOC135080842 [Ostrinia nubilalis]|uniref:uncharacterized protein LOC135080842 n=1 Tax=Ostrinia nubilalis TaxID=29057 RepID=UPI0030826AEE
MENSFFEYRDKTEMGSDSDSEIIDNSLVVAQPFSSVKTPNSKNRTVFVAESEESTSDETDQEDNEPLSKLKSVVERSSVQNQHVVLSSDDDGSNRGSIRRQSPSSPNKVVLSSSDEEEEEVSPELVPRRRPPMRPKSIDSNSDSLIGRFKSKKRMILMDSDTENSIVIEHDKNRKVKCLKDTPLKIDSGKKVAIANSDDNMSGDDESDEASTGDDEDNDEDENGDDDDDDDGPDEDQMVMSRATRMSIMGIAPRNGDSDDESDFIQSDDSKPNSRVGSACSFNDLPDVSTCIRKSQKADQKENKPDEEENCSDAEQDTSRLTCSPFTSPLKDITNDGNKNTNSQNISIIDLDLKENDSQELKNKVLSNLVQEHSYNKNAPDDDDDVTIIDSKPEIIALSSDDEDVTTEKKSPTLKKSPSIKKSPKAKDEDTSSQSRNGNPSIKQFLAPASYPNQVVYVKKHVRENELSKLNSLKEDLHNIRNLLENMDVSTLPDGGVRLIERLSALEGEVRRQGDKVANMLVEPAMATHMAERNLILDRLRILHESLATRPPEQAQASAPAALRSSLMPHQRHALAWLRWRETQRPYGGILGESILHEALQPHAAPAPRARLAALAGDAAPLRLMPHQRHALAWLRWRETQRPYGGILGESILHEALQPHAAPAPRARLAALAGDAAPLRRDPGRSSLMPHQRHALAWLRWRETQRPYGGILGESILHEALQPHAAPAPRARLAALAGDAAPLRRDPGRSSLMPHQRHALAWLRWRETQRPYGGILGESILHEALQPHAAPAPRARLAALAGDAAPLRRDPGRSSLMPHQRHALAWLRWRETQRPYGGILGESILHEALQPHAAPAPRARLAALAGDAAPLRRDPGRSSLMPHQRHALAWLRWRETQRPYGGILGESILHEALQPHAAPAPRARLAALAGDAAPLRRDPGRSSLMPHQRHALAWLRWRETQRPYGGILGESILHEALQPHAAPAPRARLAALAGDAAPLRRDPGRSSLMPHQRHALAWLRWRETQRPYGGILGESILHEALQPHAAPAPRARLAALAGDAAPLRRDPGATRSPGCAGGRRSAPTAGSWVSPSYTRRSSLMPHQRHALAWLRWRETQRPYGGILGESILHEALATRPPELRPRMNLRGIPHALACLRWRETQRPYGGILADDMGLGKTITMISLILTDKEANIDDDDDDEEERGKNKMTRGGTLVVCPASLMQQWAGEVTSHCTPHALSVCLHHGAARAAQPHRLASSDLVVTTYNILQRDAEKNGVLMRVRWRRVILDEAHIVRNHKAATSLAVSALPGRRRWCLTGTPVQNKDLDLFALMKFLRVTPFDDLAMWKKWIDNKSQGGQERLSTIMRCILLRRTKQQLQDAGQLACLPPRSAHQRPVTLAPQEMQVYQKVLVFSKTLFAQFLHQRAEKQADAGGFVPPEKDSAYAAMHKKMIALQGAKPVKSHEILVLLLRLRQVCCHCGLIASMLDAEGAGSDDPAGADLLAELDKLTLDDARAGREVSSAPKGAGSDDPAGADLLAELDKLTLDDARAGREVSSAPSVLPCGLIASMLDAEGAGSDDPAGADLLAELDKLTLDDARAGREVSSAPKGAGSDDPAGADLLAELDKLTLDDARAGREVSSAPKGAGSDDPAGADLLAELDKLTLDDARAGRECAKCVPCGLIASVLQPRPRLLAELDKLTLDDARAGREPRPRLLAELDKLTLDDARAGREGRDNKENEDEGPEESTTVAEAIRSVLAPNNPVFDLARQSSKIKAVMDCLRENVFKNKDEKAVVVSQWTSVLRLVEQELKRMKIRSVTLSGNVPVGARPPLIAALNQPGSGVQVMLLSLCAGGVGLNLCGANHLLLLDPHWNPQLEQQAQDRIYRVGQKKHVHIYRFMCVDTVEQSIRKLQEAKLELAENVLTGAKHTNSKLSIDDLKLLFNMGQPGS